MKNWGNWSKHELEQAIEKGRAEGRKSIGIDQEHTDYINDNMVNVWLDEMGLKYENKMERTVIYIQGE